jgi:DNA-binding CsgD family transcriptional regulator
MNSAASNPLSADWRLSLNNFHKKSLSVTRNLLRLNSAVILPQQCCTKLAAPKFPQKTKERNRHNLAMPIRPSPSAGPHHLKAQIPSSLESAFRAAQGSPQPAESGTDAGPRKADFVRNPLACELPRNTAEPGLSHDVAAALAYGLGLVRYGAMLVAMEGRLQMANPAALEILEKKDGLWVSNTGLITDRASDARTLLVLLREAIQSPTQGEPCESPMILPRSKARSSLIVRVVPGPGLDRPPAGRAAMVMLYDQDVSIEVDTSLLIKLYGLTRGEAALAASLMRGKSIEEAATELFISPHTARTHLKRIFMKTDTHRQTELVVRTFPALL